jgi:16S rRNA G966 N2-methylase RsmD
MIPRPETELLVERAIDFVQSRTGPQFLCDLCTGCGCIAIAVAKNLPNARITATDICDAALSVAAKNVDKYQLHDRIKLICGDLFDPIVPQLDVSKFDLIVCNPPYVSAGEYEALYVKSLILGQGAVLNTSFNHIYYQTLRTEPNSTIKNVPLLGFSLNNIAFDDKDEFITRVQHNNFIDRTPEPHDYSRTHVNRVVGRPPDPAGMMQIRNLIDRDPASLHFQQVVNARAQGLFAKSTEDQILVIFEYLFAISDPNVQLVIYLTDSPRLLDSNDSARAVKNRLKAFFCFDISHRTCYNTDVRLRLCFEACILWMTQQGRICSARDLS